MRAWDKKESNKREPGIRRMAERRRHQFRYNDDGMVTKWLAGRRSQITRRGCIRRITTSVSQVAG